MDKAATKVAHKQEADDQEKHSPTFALQRDDKAPHGVTGESEVQELSAKNEWVDHVNNANKENLWWVTGLYDKLDLILFPNVHSDRDSPVWHF